MKKIILSCLLSSLLILGILVWANAATTVYVSGSGSNTSPYDTWAKAATTPATAQTYLNGLSSSGHTMYIGAGSYTSLLALTDADAVNETVYGVSAAGVSAACVGSACQNYPAAKGDVVINQNSTNHTVNVTQAGITLKNLSLTNTGSQNIIDVEAVNLTGDNLYLYDCGTVAKNPINLNSTGFVLTNSLVSGTVGYRSVRAYAGATGTFSYVIFTNSLTNPSGSSELIKVDGAGTLTFNNCIFIGQLGPAINNAGAGTVTVNNSIIGGSVYPAATTVVNVSGTVSLSNNIIWTDWTTRTMFSGTITKSGNLPYQRPKFTRHQRSGYITPRHDDASSVAYVKLVEPELASRGMHGQYFVQAYDLDSQEISNAVTSGSNIRITSRNTELVGQGDSVTITGVGGCTNANGTFTVNFVGYSTFDLPGVTCNASYTSGGTFVNNRLVSDIQTLINNGTYAIGSHGWAHTYLDLTGNAFSITMAGKTINVDRGNDQIVVSDTVTITGFKAKTFGRIKAELTAAGATVGAYTTGLNDMQLGEALADSAGAQASPYTTQLLIDATAATGLFWVEMTHAKARMEAILTGYTAKNFATPWGRTSADVKAAIKAAGFIGNSNIVSTNPYLSSIDSYNFAVPSGNAQVSLSTYATATGMASHGGLIQVTTAANTFNTGDTVTITGTVGTTEANGTWTITVIDTTHFDLVGSTFTNAWSSGGTCYNDTQTKGAAYAWAESAAQYGQYLQALAHNTGEFTIAQWVLVLDAWAEYSDVTVTSADVVATALRSSPWSTSDDITYTRTWTDLSDYHLQSTSPAINAGTNVSLTQDYAGKRVPCGSAPDIGAYEFCRSGITAKSLSFIFEDD